jgi:hypothetical protein
MFARVYSCAVISLDGVIVEVEVDIAQRLPGMDIEGTPDQYSPIHGSLYRYGRYENVPVSGMEFGRYQDSPLGLFHRSLILL